MFTTLGKYKIVPLLTIKDIEIADALKVAESLIKGGLPAMEITFRRYSDSKAIREIAREFPDFLIGASGILNKDQFLRAVDSKAKFATAPGVCEDSIRIAVKSPIVFAPGANTPSDIERILLNSCVHFQFFPAEASGGVDYLKAILEPFEHLPLDILPKGGITLDKIKDYLKIPQVYAVSLENILLAEYVVNKQWDKITESAKSALGAALS